MIEPMIAPLVVDAAALVDWSEWNACPICRVRAGEPCVAMNGRVAGGRPDGVAVPLPRSHAARKRSKRRVTCGGKSVSPR